MSIQYDPYNSFYKLIDDFSKMSDNTHTYKMINKDDKFYFMLDVSGFKKEEIDISFRQKNRKKVLIIKSLKVNVFDKKIDLIVPLKEEHDFDNVSAKIEDGVLNISFDTLLNKEDKDYKIKIV